MQNKNSGFILMTALITMAFLTTVVLLVTQMALSHRLSARRTYYALKATAAAEAGAEKFMLEINKVHTHTGSGETILTNDTSGKTTYSTSMANGSIANEKVVTAIGRYYLPNKPNNVYVTRKIQITIRGLNPFKYGLQTGIGPLYMFGNTGLEGEVFTNSRIVVQDNTVNLSGIIKVAGLNAANDCSIEGNGKIPNSTINTRYKVCLPTPGSTVTQYDSTITPQPLPGIDKPAILASITSNATCASVGAAPYRILSAHYPNNSGGGTSGGCDVTLSANKTYTVEGSAHIRGNFTADRNSLQISNSLTQDIYILVEGRINISGNGSAVIPNNSGHTATFVSYDPTDSGGNKNASDAIEISGNSLSLNARFLNEVGSFGLTGRGLIGQVAAASIVLNGSGSLTFVTECGQEEEEGSCAGEEPSIWNVTYYQPLYN